jgi:putative endonuclease
MTVRSERARRGRAAEQLVADWVVAQGMTLLERNKRVGKLEIDLIARDDDVIAVIEVRTRGAGSWQHPFASVDAAKQRRLRRAATILWSRRFSKLPGVTRIRFDVAAVDLSGEQPSIEYVRAAF